MQHSDPARSSAVAADGVVALRPIGAVDLPMLREWDGRVESDQPFNFFPDAVPSGRRYLPALEGDEDIHRLLVILADGTPIGDVSWHPVGYGPNPGSTAYNIGIGLQLPHRGRGYGSRAQRLLADYLLAQTEVFRIEASTDVSNIAEQRSLVTAGFHREGVVRGAQYRAGAYRDLVVYSRCRTDA